MMAAILDSKGPIAHGPGGNLVLIRLDNNSPEIFFWDHETEADEGEEPSASNMYMISDGLPGFFTGLYKQAI
ncbi:SMI1/KNR4 family protein [Pseudomonas sp. Fl4BN1]|uniref:SMI1/KNR4 family protein n=1 Tax=Pseudomonas sp. Fl4BN1 TaxID=2697651 RepID=UPI0013773122|nr:SMI1/KNR4 family protein [Pseudomonas sp. Fl4BN1]NBF12638.1 hypothetical protein [Pseudomonas sp. Fl4BN1]